MWNDIFVNIFEDGFFAAIAAIGFSSISNTPRRAYLTCALTAAVGHAIRYVLTLPELGGLHGGFICRRDVCGVVCIMHQMSGRGMLLPGAVAYDSGNVCLPDYRGAVVMPVS